MQLKIDIKSRSVRILLHIVFWLSYLLLYTILAKLNSPTNSFIKIALTTSAFSLPIDIIATYFTIYVLMPRFLYTAQYVKFFIWFVVSAIFFVIMVHVIDYYVYIPNYHPEHAYKRSFWKFPYFFYIVSTYAVVILAVAIKLGRRWFESQDRQKELERQNLRSELAMLKHQISPHFLFNTLNNIDSLIGQNPQKASAAIIRLSDIMRYMLYNSQEKQVLLHKEIEYIASVIKLQSLRMATKGFIQLEIEGQPAKKKVAPLLLIPFIENAIKHGNKSVPAPGIRIAISIDDKDLHFNIVNQVDNNQQKDAKGGIGLQNVKRRLELLYPDKHVLQIRETQDIFEVSLKIPLTE
jgi:sensor histidine kinase YesM